MTRSVLFDTETTGLDPMAGDRVIEVAALELVNDLPTGRQFHALMNPLRSIPEDATRIHGITDAHLAGKPLFAEVADELVAFLGESRLIAHNAPFDFAFLNAEFSRLGRASLMASRMVDTLALAKSRFPGALANLDALCRRFSIDLSERTKLNALLDCRLLAGVYLELTGGRQRGLGLGGPVQGGMQLATYAATGPRMPRLMVPTADELAAHSAFVAKLPDAVWCCV